MEARTPYQFAKELIDKFLPYVNWNDLQEDCANKQWAIRNAKECALINLDYMESIMITIWESAGVNEDCRSSFLLSVREEIKNYNGNSN
jgi:hypothetical protein